jgi:hypothetical protein
VEFWSHIWKQKDKNDTLKHDYSYLQVSSSLACLPIIMLHPLYIYKEYDQSDVAKP